jgi:uncharacterized damage-inducible protein DinB
MDLLSYHKWATNRLLNHIIGLPENVFTEKLKGTFTSISETFAHIYDIDSLWFQRIYPDFKAEKRIIENPSAAFNYFKDLHDEMIMCLKDNPLTEVVYQNSKGETFRNEIGEIIQHLSNHGTYHRGNIATMIRQLGYEAISTDYIYYIRGKNKLSNGLLH